MYPCNGPDTVLGTFIVCGKVKIMPKLKSKYMGYFMPYKHARWDTLAMYYPQIYGRIIHSD